MIGIDEDKKSKKKKIYDVVGDENRKTEEQLIDLLRSYVAPIVEIEIENLECESGSIDVIKIIPNDLDLPYLFTSNTGKVKLKKNSIYTRIGSINTPKNENAPIKYVEKLFQKRFGINKEPLDKIRGYLSNLSNWNFSNDNCELASIYHKYDDNCKVELQENEDDYYSFADYKSYKNFLENTYLNEDIWNIKKNREDCSIEEGCIFNKAIVRYKTLEILKIKMIKIVIKHYPNIGDFNIFYLPRNLFDIINKKDILNSLKESDEYKICKLIYFIETGDNTNDIILNYINLEYLTDKDKYLKNYNIK